MLGRFALSAFIALAFFGSAAIAQQDTQLKVAGIFGDGMVVQQQTSAAIWGRAKPNSTVSVKPSWQADATVATTGADGKWNTKINTPKAGGPFKISIQSGAEKKEFSNVLSGEVWICSGQSNMQWKMRGFGVDHFKASVEKANHPQIRYLHVPQTLAFEEQEDIKAKWSTCSPKTVLAYSAVAYFFAEKLHAELDVPIGLVSTSWGGSSAEAWVDDETIADQFPEFESVTSGYPALIKKSGMLHPMGKRTKGINQRMPSVLYNNMIHPILPFTIRGVIWYQGESNVKKPVQYRKLFPAMIKNWRSKWGQGDFPFYFVQIAPYKYKAEDLPAAFLREAQLQTLSVANTGMAVTMDIGNENNIHPKQKQPVGQRLALIALAKDYGKDDLVYSGPLYSGSKLESDKIRLSFEHVGSGLKTQDDQPLTHFTIAGKDKKFETATAVFDGETIVVSSPKVPKPVAVRFGWGNSDKPNLVNQEGLPASSFRTDDWAPEKIKATMKAPARKRLKPPGRASGQKRTEKGSKQQLK